MDIQQLARLEGKLNQILNLVRSQQAHSEILGRLDKLEADLYSGVGPTVNVSSASLSSSLQSTNYAADTSGWKLSKIGSVEFHDINILGITDIHDEDNMASNSDTALATQQSIKAYADAISTDLVNDTTPQLGGDLDLNGHNIDFPSTANVSDVKDEDDMASDSATMLATQQSIKAYVDSVGGGMSDLVDDTTPQLGGDLDLNGNNIDFPSTANISDVKDEDNMASDSATMLATQQSIKAYADKHGDGCGLTRTTDQTIGTGSWTSVTWNSETWDDGYHSLVSNTDRITIPSGADGRYMFVGSVVWDANATGIRGIRVMKNGALVASTSKNTIGGGLIIRDVVSAISNAVATDYFTIEVYQNSGGNLNIDLSSTFAGALLGQ